MGIKKIDQIVQTKNEKSVMCSCTAQCRVRSLGAVLVVQSDSSREEEPAIPLLGGVLIFC